MQYSFFSSGMNNLCQSPDHKPHSRLRHVSNYTSPCPSSPISGGAPLAANRAFLTVCREASFKSLRDLSVISFACCIMSADDSATKSRTASLTAARAWTMDLPYWVRGPVRWDSTIYSESEFLVCLSSDCIDSHIAALVFRASSCRVRPVDRVIPTVGIPIHPLA